MFHEDCLSPASDLSFGSEVERFVTEDLARVYDAMLLAPRLRLELERRVLDGWLEATFGADEVVPLAEVYEAFLRDRGRLGTEVDDVDLRVAGIENAFAEGLQSRIASL